MTESLFGNAAILHSVATEAYSRVQKKMLGVQTLEKPDSLIAVVFSAFAIEAFINEVPEIARINTSQELWMPSLKKLGADWKQEKSFTLIRKKLNSIFDQLTGSQYDAGSPPFQNFETLVELRNAIAHTKPLESFDWNSANQITPGSSHPILEKLPINILANLPQDASSAQEFPLPLPLRIGTQAAAKWACNTTVNLVDAVVKSIPASQYRTTMEEYQEQFQPIL